FLTAPGAGTFSGTGDRDYWRFDAQAGDHVSVRVETDATSVYTQLSLQNASGTTLTSAGGDYYGTAQIQNFVITAPGTYYLLVYSPYNAAHYQMRVDQSHGPQLEVEGDDSQSAANVFLLTSPA